MSGRRDFLKCLAGGAVVGFPTIVPSSALGRDGHVAPSEKIVMGAIGVGRMGSGDMRRFLSKPEVRMAAICDVQQARQEQYQTLVNRHYNDNQCKTYYDFRELLERSDIDAVLIAPGERWHALMTIAAANKGKHTYTEKPIGLSIAECKAVREAVNRNGTVFQLGTSRRSDFFYRHTVELVRNGRIGEVKTIMFASGGGSAGTRLYGEPKEPPPGFDYDLWLGPSPWAPYSDVRVSIAAWLHISDYGLGSLDGAWGIHDMVTAQWINDSDDTGPLDVEPTGPYAFYSDIRDTPYQWTLEHNYANGVRLIHMDFTTARKRVPEFNLMRAGNGPLVVYGTKGWIYVSREGIITNPASLATEKIGPNQIQVMRSNDHHQNFLDAIRTGQQTITNVEVAVRAQAIAQQEYISLCLGRKLRWDPVKEEFIGDAEANRHLTRPMRSPWRL